MTTISTPYELETRGMSQIQEEKNIFPDLAYFLKIDLFEVNLLQIRRKVVEQNKISTTTTTNCRGGCGQDFLQHNHLHIFPSSLYLLA